MHFLYNRGENDGHGAIIADIRNGWGPRPKSRAWCVADRGIIQKHYFAQHLHQLGYRMCGDQGKPEPSDLVMAIDPDDAKKWNSNGHFLPGDGPELVRGVWVCPGGKHLPEFRKVITPDIVPLTEDAPRSTSRNWSRLTTSRGSSCLAS